jgi:hypothetical protein
MPSAEHLFAVAWVGTNVDLDPADRARELLVSMLRDPTRHFRHQSAPPLTAIAGSGVHKTASQRCLGTIGMMRPASTPPPRIRY